MSQDFYSKPQMELGIRLALIIGFVLGVGATVGAAALVTAMQ